jgi:hypothetical protein
MMSKTYSLSVEAASKESCADLVRRTVEHIVR